ncbi:MAG: hypothetical protein JW908_03010 [Anaerolineales bacterium]|nr:hypothetical protein [Anaerolineales bacterium]
MTTNQNAVNERNPQNEDYAWLERTRQAFRKLALTPDSAALEGIIAEGLARLKKNTLDDPILTGHMRLMVVEAQLNRALELDDSAERQAGFADGRQNCEQAAQEALAAGSGVACNLLPRAITLLSALYKAAPEARQPGLADSLQEFAAQLDDALLEQAYLRQKALEKLQSARLLVATMESLALEERCNLMIQVADQVLDAGDLFLNAGDLEMTAQVQADLLAIETALNDPALPTPRLRLFESPVDEHDLLPKLDEGGVEEDVDEDFIEPKEETRGASLPPAQPVQAQTQKRPSALRWAISIGGLVVSCLMMLCSTASLYFGLTNRSTHSTPGLLSTPVEVMAPQIEVESTQAIQPVTVDGVLFYDFSSDQGWPIGSGNNAIFGVENGSYAIEVIGEQGGQDIVIPADFLPRSVKFDALIPAEYTTGYGSFYVYCYYRDENNFHSFTFNPLDSIIFSNQVIDGEYLDAGSYPVISLKPPGSTNQIEVQCDEYSMAVIINGQGEIASIHNDEQALGAIAISAGGFGFETNGFKVLFDNLSVYEALP